MLQWVEDQLQDPSIFPANDRGDFPSDFMPRCRKIYSRMFRFFVLYYHNFSSKLDSSGLLTTFNVLFKQYTLFGIQMKLLTKKGMCTCVSGVVHTHTHTRPFLPCDDHCVLLYPVPRGTLHMRGT
uniref:Uncharacterized protein n=1 Tax=Lygus hesperus TaxID=30085 RepID=A0A0A9VS82_LYGHE